MRLKVLATTLFFIATVAFGQVDPRLVSPTELVNASVSATSFPYAVVLSAANETIYFQVTTPDAGTGTVAIDFSVDPESDVKNLTNDWIEVYSGTDVGVLIFVEDPPPYVRVRSIPTSGTLKVTVRGAGTRFRKVF